ncbi:MAG TPA: high light inducible protein [Leptolyngbyaceae cyanobacterium M33_DOE_097]|uniref:High light inducible protein n=1 Tax=Oscillatoriales cyanobacterium SpSt-418 TaxID=2282169 RepID=A0A7C3PPL4_9CYAN|nr:high light inducible protein [Leptolyngbyaceae cyanobacterium M33_DOE_097]
MQIQEQNVTSNSEGLSTQLSYPKQVEIWSGRLAMVGFMATVAAMVLNTGY